MKFLKNTAAFAFILGLSLFFEGCKKDEVKSQSCLVATSSELDLGDIAPEVITYLYTGTTLTQQTISIGSGSLPGKISYDASGKPSKIVYLDTLVTTFTYDGNGRLTQSLTVNGHQTATGKTTYAYNSSGQLILETSYGTDSNNALTPFQHYTATYANTSTQNPLTVSTYNDFSDGSLGTIDTFEYDTHKVPSVGLEVIDPGSGTNNLTKDVTTNASGDLVNTTTYTYTYSSNDYPLTVHMSSTGNSNGLAPQSGDTTYTYNCQ